MATVVVTPLELLQAAVLDDWPEGQCDVKMSYQISIFSFQIMAKFSENSKRVD